MVFSWNGASENLERSRYLEYIGFVYLVYHLVTVSPFSSGGSQLSAEAEPFEPTIGGEPTDSGTEAAVQVKCEICKSKTLN